MKEETMSQGTTRREARKIGCDEVAWISDIVRRHRRAVALSHDMPGISRLGRAADLAALLELMEILRLEFADEAAARNALSGFHQLTKFCENP
jgi:hypothetical protein